MNKYLSMIFLNYVGNIQKMFYNKAIYKYNINPLFFKAAYVLVRIYILHTSGKT